MSNRRVILRLLLALLLVGAIHFFLSFRGSDSNRLVPRLSLLAGCERARMVTVSIPSFPTTTLEHHSSAWSITSPYVAAADEQPIMRLLDALSFSPIEESSTESELRRLGTAPENYGLGASARLKLGVVMDQKQSNIAFGSFTPNGAGVYASVSGSDSVYVVASNVFAAAYLQTADFRRHSLFSPGLPTFTASFDLRRGKTSFLRFVREGEGWSLLEPEKVPAAGKPIRQLLEALRLAQVQEFIWPVGADEEEKAVSESLLASYGLDAESAVTVTLKGAEGKDSFLSFGKEAGEGLVYALAQEGTAVVTVDAELKNLALADVGVFTDSRLFPLEQTSVATMSLTEEDTTYLLSRDASQIWRFESPVSARADQEAVNAFLQRLLSLKSVDLVAENGVMVSLATNLPSVMVAHTALLGDGRFEDLRSRQILNIPPTSVQRIVLTEAEQEKPTALVLDRERGAWTVEVSATSGSVRQAELERLLVELAPLQALSIVSLKTSATELSRYGLDRPRYTISIDRVEENTVRKNLFLGDETEGGCYATVGSNDAVFVLPTAAVEVLTADLVGE